VTKVSDNEVLNTVVTDTAQTLNREIETRLSQANDLVKEIEVEIRSLDAANRQEKSKQLAANKKQCTDFRAQLDSTLQNLQRTNLIGTGKSAADRERFLTAQEKYVTPNFMVFHCNMRKNTE
jgi:hypothetical protein